MVRFVAYILWILVYPFSLLPLGVHYFFSDILAWTLQNVFGYRKSTIYTNLARSFPELKYKELDSLAKEYYRYMCDIAAESIWQISAGCKSILKVVGTGNTELMDSLIKKHSRIIVMLGHRGNWEMIGAMCGLRKESTPDNFSYYPIFFGYKVAKSAVANAFVSRLRRGAYRKFNNPGDIVASKSILHNMSNSREERCTYVFIADQSPTKARVVTKFLNQPTLMFKGAEFIARKENVPVVYMDMARLKRGRYELSYTLITEHPAECARGEITRRYAELLEEHINGNRHNWLWSHKRWKRDFTQKEVEEYRRLYGADGSLHALEYDGKEA